MPQESDKDPKDARIGSVVRGARAKIGLSQEELGNRLGVSGPTIGTYERGEVSIPLATRHKLIGELGLSPQDLDLATAVVELTQETQAFLNASFDLALTIVSKVDATLEERQSATKVLELYRDFKAKSG